MSSTLKVLAVGAALLCASFSATAGYMEDCTYLERDAKVPIQGICDKINSTVADLNKYQPPQPCLIKEEIQFPQGSPAVLCSGSVGS